VIDLQAMQSTPPTREKILVAMSGGVDSSVAALVLKQQGHDIAGAYMKNWINEDNIIGNCPWQQDIEDARAVADKIGIEFRVVNLMDEYRERIVAYLLDGYKRGLTPNPDVMCNREIKFGVFRAWARDHGYTAVATGHYAQRVENPFATGNPKGVPSSSPRLPESARAALGYDKQKSPTPTGLRPDEMRRRPQPRWGCELLPPLSQGSPRGLGQPWAEGHNAVGVEHAPANTLNEYPDSRPTYSLLEGADKNKDQSYFLALINQEQLRDARFPIGHLPKPELRRIAADAGLATAAKKDSQGICFIGEIKMQDFLRQYVPDEPGPIVRAGDGRVLGEHRGLHYYTIGQRKGIGIPSNADFQKYVVVGKRAADRALLVAFDAPDAPGLFTSELRVHSLSWVGEPVTQPCKLEGRVRYRDPRVELEFIPDETNAATGAMGGNAGTAGATGATGCSATIRFAKPQRALASGQILALHEGERLLGGAIYV